MESQQAGREQEDESYDDQDLLTTFDTEVGGDDNISAYLNDYSSLLQYSLDLLEKNKTLMDENMTVKMESQQMSKLNDTLKKENDQIKEGRNQLIRDMSKLIQYNKQLGEEKGRFETDLDDIRIKFDSLLGSLQDMNAAKKALVDAESK